MNKNIITIDLSKIKVNPEGNLIEQEWAVTEILESQAVLEDALNQVKEIISRQMLELDSNIKTLKTDLYRYTIVKRRSFFKISDATPKNFVRQVSKEEPFEEAIKAFEENNGRLPDGVEKVSPKASLSISKNKNGEENN